MENRKRFAAKLTRLREAEGWTVCKACENTTSIKREMWSRLESGRSDPEKIQSSTMVQLIDLFYPKLNVRDFIPRSTVRSVYDMVLRR